MHYLYYRKLREATVAGFNLPPGVSVWDLPGNTPEDEAWEEAIEALDIAFYKAARARVTEDEIREVQQRALKRAEYDELQEAEAQRAFEEIEFRLGDSERGHQ
jgi:hypothetical protein